MKNYPIIKSNEAVVILFTAPRHGYVLDYNDDHYADVLYKSDWSEGAFSEVCKNWFKGKFIFVSNDSENTFIQKLIHNHSGVLFTDADKARVFYLNNENNWTKTHDKYSIQLSGKNQLHIPFDEIFNDTTATTELKGAPSPSVKSRYRACVKLTTELLAENERLRNNGDYILGENQVWVINELINTSQLLVSDQLLDVKQVCVDAGIKTGVSYAAFVECLVEDSKRFEQIKCLCNNNGAKPSETPIDYISKIFTVNESYTKSITLLNDQLKELQSKYNAQNYAVDVWKGYEKRIEAAIGEDHQNGAIGFAADFIELANELLPADQPMVDQFKHMVCNYKKTIVNLNDKVRVIEEIKSVLPNRETNIPVVDAVRELVNGGENSKISDLAQVLDVIGFKYTCPVQGATEFINTLIRHGMTMPMKPAFTEQQYLDAGWTEQQLIDHRIVVKPEPAPVYDYKSIVNACVRYYNDRTENVIDVTTLLATFKDLVKFTLNISAQKPAPVAPAPTNMLEAGSIMTMLAKHFNKPIGVSDIEPAIKELISTKPRNPKLIELVESFRTQRDLIMIDKCSPATRIALEKATDLCNEVTATFNAATTETPVTPPIEWREVHEVKLGDTWWQVEPVFISEVEMFFYDPRPVPVITPQTSGVRKSDISVINLNSPDYQSSEVGYLCIDDDGVLHQYNPESEMREVKLCKNIL